MARKKKSDTAPAKESKKAPLPVVVEECHEESHECCEHGAEGISLEVQSFLSRRDDLAEKLAREIETTELKLAELKRSAALLFPERHGHHADTGAAG